LARRASGSAGAGVGPGGANTRVRARKLRGKAGRTRVRQLEAEEQLHSVQGDDVQGGRARCERSCNVAAAGGPAQGAVESRVEDVGDR
jgi:hypothetical protein